MLFDPGKFKTQEIIPLGYYFRLIFKMSILLEFFFNNEFLYALEGYKSRALSHNEVVNQDLKDMLF